MGNKYFKPAGSLEDNRSDLLYSKKVDVKSSPFKNPGDLTTEKVLGENSYFKPAGDLIDKPINKNLSYNNIDDYLLQNVSGKKYASVCELGVLMEAGRMIVSLEQLKQMIDEGYNIVSASIIIRNELDPEAFKHPALYFDAKRDMIEVEFQKFVYDEEMMERRRRF